MRSWRLVCTVLAFGIATQAATIQYSATLTGPSENPTNNSPATGFANVTINTIANTMNVSVSFSGLTAGTTASHIHCCIAPPGATGVATTTPTFPNFPLGVTSGTYNMLFDLTDAASYNSAFVTAHGASVAGAEAALLAGLAGDEAYLNIHTSNFPGGEIRGFLQPVPEPGTFAIAGFMLAALTLLKRGSRTR